MVALWESAACRENFLFRIDLHVGDTCTYLAIQFVPNCLWIVYHSLQYCFAEHSSMVDILEGFFI